MDLGTVERVAANEPLAAALAAAFSRLRSAGTSNCAVVFHPEWRPTMDVVDLIAHELSETEDISNLTLVHPSSAMTFIASALGLRAPAVQIAAQRSIYDELEDENADATASKTMFVMAPTERVEHFVRRAVREAQSRSVRRFALIFDAACVPTMEIANVLAEELLRSGSVREIGLIHPKAPLDTLVATLRLRLPTVRIAYATVR
jgi:hypothetical protein